MSPALIPSPENYKKNLENSDVKTKYQKMPYGNLVPLDNFNGFKGKNIDKYNRHGGGLSSVVKVFGCKGCRWVNTKLCPHKGDVTHMKAHANGVCSQRLELAMSLHDDGVKMTGKQMMQVKVLMDAEYFDKYIQDAAFEGKRDISDCLPWVKLRADILKDMRKQDEGNKLNVNNTKTISVSDFNKMLNNNETIIDAEYDEIDTLTDDD